MVDIQAFKVAGLVPDYVPEDFTASGSLKIEYPEGQVVSLGNQIKRSIGATAPKLTFDAPDKDALYTLLFIDPDAPTRSFAFLGPICHWVIVNIPGSEGDILKGQEMAKYIGPGPPPYTGAHRYVFLLCKQLNKDIQFAQPGKFRWDYKGFIKDHQLELVAADFYLSQY